MKTKDLVELIDNLPKHSFDKDGRPMEPVNLILVGSAKDIKRGLFSRGWLLAEKLSILTTIHSGLALLINTKYETGPLNTGYILGKPHKYGFEKPTKSDNFKRRHHMRIWKTNYKLSGKAVWLGTVSYDSGIELSKSLNSPVHHISPSLEREEEFLAHSLGEAKPTFVRLSKGIKGKINTGDPYSWSGKALVIDLGKLYEA